MYTFIITTLIIVDLSINAYMNIRYKETFFISMEYTHDVARTYIRFYFSDMIL